MENTGCLDCEFKDGVDKCRLSENISVCIGWWAANGQKIRNVDCFDSMPCFEQTLISKCAEKSTQLLEKFKALKQS